MLQGVYLPTSQSLLVYAGLALGCGGWILLAPGLRQGVAARFLRLSGSGRWSYLARFAALALVDMEANILLNKAYRYTSITSVTLLDCWTIPGYFIMIMTTRFLGGDHTCALVCTLEANNNLVLGSCIRPELWHLAAHIPCRCAAADGAAAGRPLPAAALPRRWHRRRRAGGTP